MIQNRGGPKIGLIRIRGKTCEYLKTEGNNFRRALFYMLLFNTLTDIKLSVWERYSLWRLSFATINEYLATNLIFPFKMENCEFLVS